MINKALVICLLISGVDAAVTTQEEKAGGGNEQSNRTVKAPGFTLLHEAARVGSPKAVSGLIDEGYDVNRRVSISGVLDPNYDFVDDTPLDVAMAFGHEDLAKLLRNHGGKTATEIEAARAKNITWGKPVQGLQIGVAIAIENDTSERHPTYLATYARNSGTEPQTFLTLAPGDVEGDPEKTFLLASRLKLYKLGGGHLITLHYRGEYHSLLQEENRRMDQSPVRDSGDSPTLNALPDDDIQKRGITLRPGQQIGPISIRYADAKSWAPIDNQERPDRKAQYAVALLLDISDPQSAWNRTLTVTPLPRLRFPTAELKNIKPIESPGD